MSTGTATPVLTVRQPWAHLILTGKKRFETRPQRLPERFIGRPVALHAGAAVTLGITGDYECRKNGDGFEVRPPLEYWEPLQTRAIVAIVEFGLSYETTGTPILRRYVQDETHTEFAAGEYAFGNYEIGRYAWPILNVQPVEPFPFVGGQGWSKKVDLALLIPTGGQR